MRVLVTNDDGVLAPGLLPLLHMVVARGHDAIAIAPAEDRSGASASLGPLRERGRVSFEPVELAGAGGVPAYALDGPPALAVILACRGAFGDPPDAIVSGINPGANTGRAVIHSGTVGAALTGAGLGHPALAVSITWGEPLFFDTAATLAGRALDWMIAAPRTPGPAVTLNLNVPNVALTDLRGVRHARLAPFGTVRTAVTNAGESHLQLEFRETEFEIPADTDTALVRAGYATLTALGGVAVVDDAGASAFLDDELRAAWRRG